MIVSENGEFTVEDTIHLQGGKVGHVGVMTKGMFKTGDTVTLKVDEENRALTARNHSATHLLHKALRTVLGNHVEQAGSLVTRDRLRFDFTHFSAMTPEEIRRVEEIVNKEIAAGVRRIEALTSDGLMAYYAETEKELHEAAAAAKTTPDALTAKIEAMLEEIKALHSENEKLKSKLAKEAMGDVMDQVQEVKGVKVLAVRADGVDMNGLRNLGDQLKEKLGEGVIVIASVLDGKVNLMATATDGAQKAGAHAGNLIKAIAGLVGGGGGGRPNMAQAGGKNPAGVDEALAKVAETVESQVR